MRPQIAVGVRVIVPLGARRYYTGLVMEVLPPEAELPTAGKKEVKLKEVVQVLDSRPVVPPESRRLWQWMAHYYICSEGEVMKAAFPSGMKMESETTVCAQPEFEEGEDEPLTPSERELLCALGNKPCSIATLEKRTERHNLLPVIRRLVEAGAVYVQEEIAPTYRPKTIQMVRLVLPTGELRPALDTYFRMVNRSTQQEKLLLKLLDDSGVLGTGVATAVERAALLKAVGCTAAPLNELRKKGIVEIVTQEAPRRDTATTEDAPLLPPNPLSEAQQEALDGICRAFETQQVCLLHGVTSSGKTEVYIHLIRKAWERGQCVLMMLPEIALTTQLTARLRRVFGRGMVVYHSKLSDRQRVEIWQQILDDDHVRLVVGVRSAVLLPLRHLGLIIVDEEHEPSFKQQDPAPRYHGRDTAIVLARLHGAKVLLGSATPSLESYYLALRGKYGLVSLTRRHADRPLPAIQLVSMKEPRREQVMTGPFTPTLLGALRQTFSAGKQAILFQNRRGFAPLVECPACSWSPRCPRCDVSLTYHKGARSMTCHYCGYTQPLPERCPSCGGTVMEQIGYGTERIEELARSVLPQARTLRMDTDTTGRRDSYEQYIRRFEEGHSNLLIGTQMVSKGLDFNGVNLVGILNADALMKQPDFRAMERAFQLMEQVAGRAGRHGGGRVLIQCTDPHHPLLQFVLAHDYVGMAQSQLSDRQRFGYPPFTRMIALYLKGRYEERLDRVARHYAALLQRTFGNRVLGPDAPPVSRVKLFYIRKILLKIERDASPDEVRRCLTQADAEMQHDPDYSRVVIYYDVDPM
jgi:primosomal protein N' (replication factor Y)